jgi:MscS family membrane protein
MDVLTDLAASPWIVSLGLLVAALVAGRVLGALIKPALGGLARRSQWRWDDELVAAAATPVAMIVAVQVLRGVLPRLAVDAEATALVVAASSFVTTALVLWAGFRMVDVVVAILSSRSWAAERPSTRSLLSITGRLAKGIIVVFAAIVLLSHLGVSVASLVAGVGIGGLALALAAQKTVENLFGTLSLGVDQPMREGDFVKVGDTTGTVEAIGLRSTRLRTLDRTVVTIPNAQLADERIESYATRDRFRLLCTLGLVYGTSAAQLRAVLDGVEARLRAHPAIWPDTVQVRFVALGASSLDVEVMAWFQVSDWQAFLAVRQDVLLQFMEVVEGAGTSFAFPTRTIHVAGGGAPRATSSSAHPA